MSTRSAQNQNLKKIIGIATFSALAFVSTLFIHIPIQFLTFDVKDAIICIASFIYGPLSAIIIALISAALELVTISSTGPIGFVMNFISSAAFSFVASYIYCKNRRLDFAIIGIYCAVIVLTGVMLILNIFLTPIYLGVPTEAVLEFLPTLLLPFNLAKALLNGAIAMLLYKPIVVALRRAKLLECRAAGNNKLSEVTFSPDHFSKMTVVTIIVGALTIAVGVVIFFIIA